MNLLRFHLFFTADLSFLVCCLKECVINVSVTDPSNLLSRQEWLMKEQLQTIVHNQCCALKVPLMYIDFMISFLITGSSLKIFHSHNLSCKNSNI